MGGRDVEEERSQSLPGPVLCPVRAYFQYFTSSERLSAARDGPLICQLPGRSLLLLTPDLACPNSNRRWVGCV